MPGILPMKVIKVGTTAQSRIAQACDRCRSKKIRCDGFRPTCTQCANVGFECKTSDKLSRRAFPRGYTESLEERVRTLEGEVRELKDLLDEKEEKIDMLSKMHSRSPHTAGSSRRASSIVSTSDKGPIRDRLQSHKQDTFKLPQLPYLYLAGSADLQLMGGSSTRALIAAFKDQVQESDPTVGNIDPETFFTPRTEQPEASLLPQENRFWSFPSRIHSDQMVNIFFQEWAPLFPILHRPSFLALYEQYINDSSSVLDKRSLAQLNLVFGIAALSNEIRADYNAELCEQQWTTALGSFVKRTSLVTLQCLLLAQIYCIQKGEYNKLVHYRGAAVAMSQRLALHMPQKGFTLGTLTNEMRKRVFWSLYTLDSFSAALLGLPRMMVDNSIDCEYPVDADDEYITEEGFQPTLPGEFTKVSSGLALFKGARILAKVLDQNYANIETQEMSMSRIADLDEELEAWSSSLPEHLQLRFVQDKPSTNMTSSRSPILSLAYNFIKTLLHRPALYADLGDTAPSSVVALASAHKQIVQIIRLLSERSLSFSACLNKNDILLSCGFGILYQSKDLEPGSKLFQDSLRNVCAVIAILDRCDAPGAAKFKQLCGSILALPISCKSTPSHNLNEKKSRVEVADPNEEAEHCLKQLAALNARYTMAIPPSKKISRNGHHPEPVTVPSIKKSGRRGSEKSLRPLAPLAPGQRLKGSQGCNSSAIDASPVSNDHIKLRDRRASVTNLDFFSFSDATAINSEACKRAPADPNAWESMLNSLNGPNLVKNNELSESVYDWPPMDSVFSPETMDETLPPTHYGSDVAWSPDVWNLTADCQDSIPPQSVLSLSDDSFTSGEDFSSLEFGSTRGDSTFRNASLSLNTPKGQLLDETTDI